MTIRTLARMASAAIIAAMAVTHVRAEEPETVMITLHAKSGTAAQLETVIARHWETAKRLKLIQETPHVTMRKDEPSDQVSFIEVLTWRDASIPDRAPAEIQSIWAEMIRLVEP